MSVFIRILDLVLALATALPSLVKVYLEKKKAKKEAEEAAKKEEEKKSP